MKKDRFFFLVCFENDAELKEREGCVTEKDDKKKASVCLLLLFQHLLSMFFIKDFSSANDSLVTKDAVFTDMFQPSNQFLNKSVLKNSLIDLYVCLSSL